MVQLAERQAVAESVRHFIIYLSKLLLFSSDETTKSKARERVAVGSRSIGAWTSPYLSVQRLLGRTYQKDKRREVRAPSFSFTGNMANYSLLKKVFIINTFLLSCIALPAQVMWNLKGGIMPVNEKHVYGECEPKLNWMAGLEIEIPLNKILNLETGLRYKYSTLCLESSSEEYDVTNHLEIPIRLTYKYKLRDNLILHAGIGPYLGGGWLEVGIEPSVALNWKSISLGLSYTNPLYIDKGSFDKHKSNSGLMLTFGYRFRSNKWKYVGAGLAAAGAVAGTVYAATQGDYSGSSYIPSGSYSGSSVSSSSISSSNSDNSTFNAEYYLTAYQRFENLAKDHFNTLTNLGGYKVKKNGKDVSGSNLQSLSQPNFLDVNDLLIKAQAEMRKIRTEAAKKGINIPKSEYEDVQVKW